MVVLPIFHKRYYWIWLDTAPSPPRPCISLFYGSDTLRLTHLTYNRSYLRLCFKYGGSRCEQHTLTEGAQMYAMLYLWLFYYFILLFFYCCCSCFDVTFYKPIVLFSSVCVRVPRQTIRNVNPNVYNALVTTSRSCLYRAQEEFITAVLEVATLWNWHLEGWTPYHMWTPTHWLPRSCYSIITVKCCLHIDEL